jgi:hypothetical protein
MGVPIRWSNNLKDVWTTVKVPDALHISLPLSPLSNQRPQEVLPSKIPNIPRLISFPLGHCLRH